MKKILHCLLEQFPASFTKQLIQETKLFLFLPSIRDHSFYPDKKSIKGYWSTFILLIKSSSEMERKKILYSNKSNKIHFLN